MIPIDKVKNIIKRYDLLEKELSSGKFDAKLFAKKSKEYSDLKNIIEPIDPREAKNISREKIVYLCTGSQGEPMGAMMRISSYIHPDVFIEKGDTVIFSSKIIPGNEKKLYK